MMTTPFVDESKICTVSYFIDPRPFLVNLELKAHDFS